MVVKKFSQQICEKNVHSHFINSSQTLEAQMFVHQQAMDKLYVSMQQNLAIKGDDLLIQSEMWINLIFNAEWKKPNKLTYSMNQLTNLQKTKVKTFTTVHLEDNNKKLSEKFFYVQKIKS